MNGTVGIGSWTSRLEPNRLFTPQGEGSNAGRPGRPCGRPGRRIPRGRGVPRLRAALTGDPALRGDQGRTGQRLRLTRSCRSSSDAVMTLLFAWKPRWATIRPVNSSERSTLDISSAPAFRVPRPPLPAAPTSGLPELSPARYELFPALARPLGLLKVAMASWPMGLRSPLEKMPVIVPSLPSANDSSVPIADPLSRGLVAVAVLLPPNWVTPLRSRSTSPQPAVTCHAGVLILPLPSKVTVVLPSDVAPSFTSSVQPVAGAASLVTSRVKT